MTWNKNIRSNYDTFVLKVTEVPDPPCTHFGTCRHINDCASGPLACMAFQKYIWAAHQGETGRLGYLESDIDEPTKEIYDNLDMPKPRGRNPIMRDERGNRRCSSCGVYKPEIAFPLNKVSGRGSQRLKNCLRCQERKRKFDRNRVRRKS